MPNAELVPWPVRAVVFDLDGLMIDTEPIFQECASRLLARRGQVPALPLFHAMMGTPAKRALQILRERHELTETVEELAVECSNLFYEVLGDAEAPLFAGVHELLDRLDRKGIPRAIATSSSARYVQRILRPHRVLDRFAFVLTCEDVSQGKPFPEIYEKAAARFGATPAEMIVLEDSPAGLRAAKAAGARCVVVPHELVPRDELEGADAVVPSLLAPRLLELLGI
jgi:HAD superfamily hydrolase (TIGR01509 family)